jgi:hypothetical protein
MENGRKLKEIDPIKSKDKLERNAIIKSSTAHKFR